MVIVCIVHCLVHDLFLTFRNKILNIQRLSLFCYSSGKNKISPTYINIRSLHATAGCQIALGPTYSSFNSLSAQINVMVAMVAIADAESTITS